MENKKIQAEIDSGRIRKFYLPGIILGAGSVLLSFFCPPAASIIVGVVSLALNIKMQREYRTKIGIVLSVIGLFEALLYMGMLFCLK